MFSSFKIRNNELIKYIGKDKCIKLPDNVLSINEKAFIKSNINEIDFNNVTEIPSSLFLECETLKKIKGDNIKMINESAFEKCNRLEIAELKNLKIIGRNAFSNCNSLKSINSNNIKKIGYCGLLKCYELENIKLENLEIIEPHAFVDCEKIKEINIKNLKKLYVNAFHRSAIEKIIIHNEEPLILEEGIFSSSTNIKEIQIDDVEIKGEFLFNNCYNLNKVKIKNIINEDLDLSNNDIFGLMASLKELDFKNKNYNVIDNIVYTKDNKELIMYPNGLKNEYYIAPSTLEKIDSLAFPVQRNLKEINLNNCKIKEIDMMITFNRLVNLEKLIINKNIKIKNNEREVDIEICENELEYLINKNKTFREINEIMKKQNDDMQI